MMKKAAALLVSTAMLIGSAGAADFNERREQAMATPATRVYSSTYTEVTTLDS